MNRFVLSRSHVLGLALGALSLGAGCGGDSGSESEGNTTTGGGSAQTTTAAGGAGGGQTTTTTAGGAGGGQTTTAAGGAGGGQTTTGAGGAGGAAPGSDLDGAWETVCYNKARTRIAYDKLALTGTYTEFAEDTCTTPIHVSKWTGTTTVTGVDAGGNTKIDIAFATFTSTAITADNAAFNNMNKYCGATDWMAGVEKDVLGADCYGFSIPKGAKSLDIYRVAGDTLKFGQGAKIGTSLVEADRPTAIDDTRVFTRAQK